MAHFVLDEGDRTVKLNIQFYLLPRFEDVF